MEGDFVGSSGESSLFSHLCVLRTGEHNTARQSQTVGMGPRVPQSSGGLLETQPTLDTFVSSRSLQIPRYMTWEEVSRVTAINALDYYWDPVTWPFLPVPLFPLALERVLEQQIKAILICLEWKGEMW